MRSNRFHLATPAGRLLDDFIKSNSERRRRDPGNLQTRINRDGKVLCGLMCVRESPRKAPRFGEEDSAKTSDLGPASYAPFLGSKPP